MVTGTNRSDLSGKALTGKAAPMSDGRGLTEADIARCKDAMSKPAPIRALALIASGRVIVEVAQGGRDVLIDTLDGKGIRDNDHPDCKMGLAGAWPLYGAGMIDQFGIVTDLGRAALTERGGSEHE